MIKSCNCPDNTPAAKYQTETYGKGQRVWTQDKGVAKACTICGARGDGSKKK